MTELSPSLAGKTALIIGGSRGIGAAIVRRLAADGAAVVFTFNGARDQAQALAAEITAGGGRATALQADSGDATALPVAIDQAAEALGGLDILVNNAGILIPGGIASYSLEDFDRMYAVNVRAVFVAVKAALPHIRRGGRVVTIGSITQGRQGAPGSTVYGMTKAAVARLVRGLAWDLAPYGITINDVQPGPTATDIIPTDGPIPDRLRQASPLGRLGEPAEIANLVAFLVGPQATYMNGAGLTIDGGFAA